MRKLSLVLLLLCILFCSCRQQHNKIDRTPRDTQSPGFVYVQGDHFMLDGKAWFPLMLNYKPSIATVNDTLRVIPAHYYQSPSLAHDFQRIADMGFNSIRICLDIIPEEKDFEALYRAIGQMVDTAEQCQLKVMLLIKRPLEDNLILYTEGLLKHLADKRALWAYDFFNEPLYFDEVEQRDKMEAYQIVCSWRDMMNNYAPHQLFTIGFAEPIEVFEWDPTILPVDFVEVHTYHPLRVASEMCWYSNVCTDRPWMIGETALPADNDSVSYEYQRQFLPQSYRLARQYHAAGYGWWEYHECPDGLNFEAQFTGLVNQNNEYKPAVAEISRLSALSIPADDHRVPSNYYNMLGYNNIVLRGKVIDSQSGQGIKDAVVRGWTKDWIGMNTYTDEDGNFTLYSNDFNIHFEVSAPGMNTIKFSRNNIQYHFTNAEAEKIWTFDNLPDQYLEYQSLDYKPFLETDSLTLDFNPSHFNQHKIEGEMGVMEISKLVN